jgi:hypothetical protein
MNASGSRRTRTRVLSLLACELLAVAMLLAATVSAGAYRIGGWKWPTHTITYYNAAPASAHAVADAVRAWNTSGARIHFVATSRSHASVVIASMSTAEARGELGLATLGWAPPGFLTPSPSGRTQAHGDHVWLVPPSQTGDLPAYALAQVAAHELGHIIGLGHELHRCATMNASVGEHCPLPQPWQQRCRILEADDIRGAIALYGGHVGPLGPEFCDVAELPGPPIGLAATITDPLNGIVQLSWTNPAGVTIGSTPVQINGRATVGSYIVNGAQGSCPPPSMTSDYFGGAATRAGEIVSTTVQATSPGSWCFTVTIVDSYNRFGPAAQVQIDVPAPPAVNVPTPPAEVESPTATVG